MSTLDRLFDGIATPDVEPPVRARIEAAIRESLQPVSTLPSTAIRAGQFFLVFVAIGALKIAVLGTIAFRQMSESEAVGHFAVTAVAALMLSFSLAREMTPGRLRRLSPAITGMLLIVTYGLGATLLLPSTNTNAFMADGWPCLRAGMIMSLPLGVLFSLLIGRGTPRLGGALGQTLGTSAGLLAATVPTVPLSTCSHEMVLGHLVVFHGGVVVLSAMLGVMLLPVLRRVSLSRRHY